MQYRQFRCIHATYQLPATNRVAPLSHSGWAVAAHRELGFTTRPREVARLAHCPRTLLSTLNLVAALKPAAATPHRACLTRLRPCVEPVSVPSPRRHHIQYLTRLITAQPWAWLAKTHRHPDASAQSNLHNIPKVARRQQCVCNSIEGALTLPPIRWLMSYPQCIRRWPRPASSYPRHQRVPQWSSSPPSGVVGGPLSLRHEWPNPSTMISQVVVSVHDNPAIQTPDLMTSPQYGRRRRPPEHCTRASGRMNMALSSFHSTRMSSWSTR